MKTALDVVTQSLVNLNVIAIDEEAEASVYENALNLYKNVHNELIADLRDKHKVRGRNWDYDSVPDDIWFYVANILAPRLVSVVSINPTKYQIALNEADNSMAGIIKILSPSKRSANRFPDFPNKVDRVDFLG